MAKGAAHTQPSARELAELSALADGSLDSSRRATVEARIAASPELSALYERERRVVAALHQARATDRAPAGLRARIEAARPARAKLASRRIGYAGGVASALAAIALALVLALPSGAPGAPSVSDAAALATRGPSQGAPAPEPHAPAALQARVGKLYFPNWASQLGLRAVGARSDDLRGHKAVTVYYESDGNQIAYTIVAAPDLTAPGAQRTVVNGTELWTFATNGRTVVAWRLAGDTCVLSATGIMASELQMLAAWRGPAESRSSALVPPVGALGADAW
jgi:anti-sigma factor RsiW